MAKFIIDMHLDGYESEEDMVVACMEYLDNALSHSAITGSFIQVPDDILERVSKLKEWSEMTDSELRLYCGELTAQEIRSIRAVLYAIRKS